MTFIFLIGLIYLLFNPDRNRVEFSGEVGIYYDNSLSSSLIGTDLQLKNGLNHISQLTESFIYLDNTEKTFLNKSSVSSLVLNKSINTLTLSSLFNQFRSNRVSSHYIFSDFQSLDPHDLKEYFGDSVKQYQLVLINDLNQLRNVHVDSLYLVPNQEDLSELSVFMRFDVFNMTVGSVVIKLMQGARQISSVVKDVSELDVVRFDISKQNEGDFQVIVDGDDVDYDNEFHFNIGTKNRPKVSIIETRKSNSLNKVFDNNEMFDVNNQKASNLNYDLLQTSDLILVSDLFRLPNALQNQLSNVDFIVFPSDSVDVNTYESFIGNKLDLLSEGNPSEISIDSNHPLLIGIFDKRLVKGSMPIDRPIFQVNGDFEPIINFRNGQAFLIRNGNVYFFNSKIDSNSRGFQSNALFLPILYQIAFASINNIEPAYYYPGDKISVSVKASDVPIKLVRPGFEVIPLFNSNGTQMILELPNELEPGNYFLIHNDDSLRSISVNYPKEESIMKAPSLADITEVIREFRNVTATQITTSENNVFLASRSQTSLWKYALILIVFLLLTETVLHKYLK